MIRKIGPMLSLLFLGTLFFTGAFVLTADTARADEWCCVIYDHGDLWKEGVWTDPRPTVTRWCRCNDYEGAIEHGCNLTCPGIE